MKKKLIFRARGKHRKMFSAENIFRKNDFPENIFRRKPFYAEVNGALRMQTTFCFPMSKYTPTVSFNCSLYY
jgi:hypothetical protein